MFSTSDRIVLGPPQAFFPAHLFANEVWQKHIRGVTPTAGEVRIRWVDACLKAGFRNVTTARPTTPVTLLYHDLVNPAGDAVIISALGGEGRAETNLWHLCALLEKQGKGEEGRVKRGRGELNIFFVRDSEGRLEVVYVSWVDDGWFFSHRNIDDPRGDWSPGTRIFYLDV